MSTVRPEELSALLDGELDPQREREVRAQLATDPALSRELESLRRLDAQWATAGAAARFVPTVSLPTNAVAREVRWPVAALLLILLPIRLVSKMIDGPAMGWILNGIALAFVLTVMILLLRNDRHSTGQGLS